MLRFAQHDIVPVLQKKNSDWIATGKKAGLYFGGVSVKIINEDYTADGYAYEFGTTAIVIAILASQPGFFPFFD